MAEDGGDVLTIGRQDKVSHSGERVTKEGIEISKNRAEKFAWQKLLQTAAAGLAALGLVLLSNWGWQYFQASDIRRMEALFVWGILNACLALLLERALAGTVLPQAWRYRLAVLLSAGLGAAIAVAHRLSWLIVRLQSGHAGVEISTGILGFLIAGALGALLGGLAATSLNESLWEDNAPPPEWILADVHRMHQAYLPALTKEAPAKYLFDRIVAGLALLLSLPLMLLITALIWFEDPGPVWFIKNSVGRGGVNFRQFKFRTMVRQAEVQTGPVLSELGDSRVLTVGRVLRKTALDELPQLVNILSVQMSFVGPRPQRTVLVHDYLERMPEYAERHQVRPGLAGLAQVVGDYYLTPRQKLRFDRLYIRYAGLGFDLRLLFLAFAVTFWFRWKKSWNGRLPRHWLHRGRRS